LNFAQNTKPVPTLLIAEYAHYCWSRLAGALIPSPFWKNNENVMGLMIEIRRDLYIDESTFQLRDNSKLVRRAICDAILAITHSLTGIKCDE
jgi:hypothetical protein